MNERRRQIEIMPATTSLSIEYPEQKGDLVATVAVESGPSGSPIQGQTLFFDRELAKLHPEAIGLLEAHFRRVRNDDPRGSHMFSQMTFLGSAAATVGFNLGYQGAMERVVAGRPDLRAAMADTIRSFEERIASRDQEIARLKADLELKGTTAAKDHSALDQQLAAKNREITGLKADLAKESDARKAAEGKITETEQSVDKRANMKAAAIVAQRGISVPIREEISPNPGNDPPTNTSALFGAAKARAVFRAQLEKHSAGH